MPHEVDHHAILDRYAEARGRVRNIYDTIDPARTAHLVVDMQNGFMEEGAPVEDGVVVDFVRHRRAPFERIIRAREPQRKRSLQPITCARFSSRCFLR